MSKKISFYKKPKFYKNYIGDWDSREQIIVCENGVFKRCKANSICYIVKKTSFEKLNVKEEDVVFDYIGETPISLEEKPYMKKKIPKGIVDTVLRYYQVFAKNNLEVKLNIWYDKVNDEFFIDSPFQINGATFVRDHAFDHPGIIWTDELSSKFPEKLKLKERKQAREIELVLDTHSHHNMSCSFSSTDDEVDYYKNVEYKMVAVYKTVLTYPTLDLRYFVNPYSKSNEVSAYTLIEDEVRFDYRDIIDENNLECKKYDFNKFAESIGYGENELF